MIIDIFGFQFQLLLVVLGGMMSAVAVFVLPKKVNQYFHSPEMPFHQAR